MKYKRQLRLLSGPGNGIQAMAPPILMRDKRKVGYADTGSNPPQEHEPFNATSGPPQAKERIAKDGFRYI
jgi:hypothetical protein